MVDPELSYTKFLNFVFEGQGSRFYKLVIFTPVFR